MNNYKVGHKLLFAASFMLDRLIITERHFETTSVDTVMRQLSRKLPDAGARCNNLLVDKCFISWFVGQQSFQKAHRFQHLKDRVSEILTRIWE